MTESDYELHSPQRERILLASLGTTPQPLVASIRTHRPGRVWFLGSAQTLHLVDAIVAQCGLAPDRVERHDVVNAESIQACFESMRTLLARLDQLHPGCELMVDLTGGTKCMSAALALAVGNREAVISYVGGARVNGRVQDGCEEVQAFSNPIVYFGVDAKTTYVWQFNQHHYAAAAHTAAMAATRVGLSLGDLWRGLERVARGFDGWDALRHRNAKNDLSGAIAPLERFTTERPESLSPDFLAAVRDCRGELDAFLRLPAEQAYVRKQWLVGDVLGNATRRAAQGRYEDACARVYYCVELLGQAEFEKIFGCPTGKVPTAQIPDSLRGCYWFNPNEPLQRLALQATYECLREVSSPLGRKYAQMEREFRDIQQFRNRSILAHGTDPVSRELYERVVEYLQQLTEIRPREFPALETLG